MSFDTLASRHPRDPDLPLRAHRLNLLLRFVAPDQFGSIYDLPPSAALRPFDRESEGQQYVAISNRRPNIPAGSNEIKSQINRQASMVFGDSRFPTLKTTNDEARRIFQAFIAQAGLVELMRSAVVIGSVGSVAIHLRALAPPGGNTRIYASHVATAYLTPTFDPFRPDVVNAMLEKYKIKGYVLEEAGYEISKDDRQKDFWFQRIWDLNAETWYMPWKVSEQKEAERAGQVFVPEVDNTPGRTIQHNLGICPWLWVKNLAFGLGPDGACQFTSGLDHAISLDYLASQVTAAVKYTMCPTLVIETPMAAPVEGETTDKGDEGVVMGPSRILTLDENGKAYYLEISGDGIEKAQSEEIALKRQIIENIQGDRVDPTEVTQGHQGAKSLEMLNAPMLGLCENLRSAYGNALLALLRMVAKMNEDRALEIGDEIIPARGFGDLRDLALKWGAFYSPTTAEMFAQAQAISENIESGILSRQTAIENIATDFGIANISQEETQIAADQAQEIAREKELAAQVQVKATQAP